MEKNYNPKKVEAKIYRLWEKGGYFTPKIEPSKKPFVIIMPPPNANGLLHIGHAVFVTLEDILIRYQRMKGRPSLWLPGFDHAGIATQVTYEKLLQKQGKTPSDLGREKFYQEVYQFTMENKKIMENQLKKLGASCDWSRQRFTLDPKITEAVYQTFKKMYQQGLIYRGERIINWCPRCQTSLSDLEIKNKEEKGKLWYIKYPLIENPKSKIQNPKQIQNSRFKAENFIIVSTTRPETMLGDTAVAVHPRDKRYKALLGQGVKIRVPLVDRAIPLIADERIKMEFGTGAVKVTPAHDFLDFEIGKEHNLPIITIIGKDGRMTREAGKDYVGLDIFSCRKKIIEDLKKQGLLLKEEDYNQTKGLCERCQTVIESLVSEQWFIKAKELARPAIEAVKKKKIKFIPAYYEKIYLHWLKNIKDWCISRQIWWGQRIPVWYCQCGEIIVEKKSPKKCPKCKKTYLWQDSDTLDTWFSSGQWPFTVFGWPQETRDYKYFYPTTVMETGYDILFFWVARMIMLGIYCTGKVPFKYVYLHGLVRDKDRQKMSKSKGNVIDPLRVVDLSGADALRMALVFGNNPGKDVIISEEKIITQRRFANKIWNAARFTFQKLGSDFSFLKLKKQNLSLTKEDQRMLSELNSTIKKVTLALETFNFHRAASQIYHFFWHQFCDKTIEDVKKRNDPTAKWVLYKLFLDSLKLLHPFLPFITEEIYQMLAKKPKKALIIENWPKIES